MALPEKIHAKIQNYFNRYSISSPLQDLQQWNFMSNESGLRAKSAHSKQTSHLHRLCTCLKRNC